MTPFSAHDEFTWQPYRTRPFAVWALRMNNDFECVTLSGMVRGNAGDWKVRGDDGHEIPVPDIVFRKFYAKREWRRPDEKQKEGHGQKHEERHESSPKHDEKVAR